MLGDSCFAKEAKFQKVRHLAGHQRLGLGFTACGKTVGKPVTADQPGRSDCELCVAREADENMARSERNLLRKNCDLMRSAKIKAEEAMLQMQGEMLFIKEQNLGLSQEVKQARADSDELYSLRAIVLQLCQSPIRVAIRVLLGQKVAPDRTITVPIRRFVTTEARHDG